MARHSENALRVPITNPMPIKHVITPSNLKIKSCAPPPLSDGKWPSQIPPSPARNKMPATKNMSRPNFRLPIMTRNGIAGAKANSIWLFVNNNP
jgi:hypothetical protein